MWTAVVMQWPRDGFGKRVLADRQLQQFDYNNESRVVFYVVCAEELS
jgi:hypothetical protein